VGSTAQRKMVREQADFLFEPPLEGIGMSDWRAFDRCVEQGYVHALLEIE
jgi:NTE family protein